MKEMGKKSEMDKTETHFKHRNALFIFPTIPVYYMCP